MEKMENRIPFWSSKIGWINILLVLILALAAFLRLYRISEYMTFLGDEGRDVLVAKQILEGDFTLLGPRSSAADFFYGPIYYYLIAPFLWLFNFDPVGPAVMVALIGIATVFLVYKVGSEMINKEAGVIAAAFYAVSPVIIAYSRSSWNPNPLPFISLLTLYILYKAIQSSSNRQFFFVGILLGIAIQLQYLSLFLIATVAAYIFLASCFQKKKIDILMLSKRYFRIFLGFLIGFSPFLLFEVKHGFPNTKTIINFIFFTRANAEDAARSLSEISSEVLFKLFGRLVARFPPPEQVDILKHNDIYIHYLLVAVLIITSIYFLNSIKNKLALILFSTWLFLGVILFGFYKKQIYDYYLGFMFPLPFLVLSNAISSIYNSQRFKFVLKTLSIGIFLFIFLFNLDGMPFKYPPNNQRGQVKKISEFVLSKTDAKPFNFALLTLGNSDHAYKYYMEIENRPPVEIKDPIADPERKSVTDQLLIICEDPNCQPLGNPLWEVAGFGRATIAGEWQVSVVKVYKLLHYQEQR